MSEVLAYVAAGLVGLWGVAHAIPTRQVLAGFDDLHDRSAQPRVTNRAPVTITRWPS